MTTDLDEKGLEAAELAYRKTPAESTIRACLTVAIRAYEAHNVSEYLDVTIKAMEFLERAQRAEKALEAHKASQAGVGDLSMNPDLYDEGGNLKASAVSSPPTDGEGLEAAMAAYDDNTDEHGDVSRRGLEAAIRAYEAYPKADFNWRVAYRKEHADAGTLLTENYLLRKQIEALNATILKGQVKPA